MQWFPEVKHFCREVPVILIGCKIDLRKDKECSRKLKALNLAPITYIQVRQRRTEPNRLTYLWKFEVQGVIPNQSLRSHLNWIPSAVTIKMHVTSTSQSRSNSWCWLQGEETRQQMNAELYLECSAKYQENVDDIFREATKKALAFQRKQKTYKRKKKCVIL